MRAQVSLEAIVAIGVLLMVMLAVYVQLGMQQPQAGRFGSLALQRDDCAKLQAAIALVQNPGANAQIEFSISSDVNLSGKLIKFEDYYCYFQQGNGINAQLLRGNILVKSGQGVVTVENF